MTNPPRQQPLSPSVYDGDSSRVPPVSAEVLCLDMKRKGEE